MIEVLVTSFPFVLRVLYLRWRGMPITLYNVHRALVMWFALAAIVFFAVFYYYPKSYTGIIPFRTVPVVAETSGTVTEIFVHGGDSVEVGDPLFAVENASERASVEIAQRQVEEIESAIAMAELEVETARASLDAAEAAKAHAGTSVADHRELQARGSAAFQTSQLERALTTFESQSAQVRAAESQLAAAEVQVSSVMPAQKASAQANLDKAKVDLAKTITHSLVDGTVEQLALHVGVRAVPVPMSPAMLIVPDRTQAERGRIVAGFSQVSHTELYEGMAAEVACESNFNIGMRNTVLPARIARIQDPIAAGQITPSGRLIEPSERAKRGQIVVHLDLVHPEHHNHLVPGSACIVQSYTTSLKGPMEGTMVAHAVEAMGIIKAVGIRIKSWLGLASGIGLVSAGH